MHFITKFSPFKTMYGFNHLTLLDLLHLPVDERVSFDGNRRAQVVKNLHTKVQQHIERMNEQYVFKVNKGIKNMVLEP
jgi:phage-related protein